jgi:serine/threonine protein kinase
MPSHHPPRTSALLLRPQPLLLAHLLDVARGMAYVHSQGICHGDLKAANVLLARDPSAPHGCTAKVADFGLSRALAMGASHLSTRTYGTVTHMAPELLSSGHLRQANDVYSFGIMSEQHPRTSWLAGPGRSWLAVPVCLPVPDVPGPGCATRKTVASGCIFKTVS